MLRKKLFVFVLYSCIGLQIGGLSPFAARGFSATDSRSLAIVAPLVAPLSPRHNNLVLHETDEFGELLSRKRSLEELASLSSESDEAIIHVRLASTYSQRGDFSRAVREWEQAAAIYRGRGKEGEGELGKVLADMAQGYIALGQNGRARELLTDVIALARKRGEVRVEAVALGVLGNARLIGGDADGALQSYRASLADAAALNNPLLIAVASTNLGKVFNILAREQAQSAQMARREGDEDEEARLKAMASRDRQRAEQFLNRAVGVSQSLDNLVSVTALISLATFKANQPSPNLEKVADIWSRASGILSKLPGNRLKAIALIKLAAVSPTLDFKIHQLEEAISVAGDDLRTLSYARGALGEAYLQASLYDKALSLTHQAAFAAQQVRAMDSLYRWQWQAGRIYAATGQEEAALASYRQACATLQDIRGDIAAASRDMQFDLRDEVEPVYRQYLELLLLQPTAERLEESLQVFDLLRLSEVQNYFGDDCIQIQNVPRFPGVSSSAIITSIILPHKSYILLRLPNGSIKSYPVAITKTEMERLILHFRHDLEDPITNKYLVLSRRLFDLLIRPMLRDLDTAKPSKLVFVNDGLLRNIPMAALNDGKHFLVEKYPIAVSLGFNLSVRQKVKPHRALIFGLSVPIPPFAALPGVVTESQEVARLMGGSKFLDSEFTENNLQKQVHSQNYSILHLATHGKFGATADSTFFQAYDARISLKQFEQILANLRQPINLLTLSACQTAVGDNRSTLGLAGVALRNGVKNVLATLWFANDPDTVPKIC